MQTTTPAASVPQPPAEPLAPLGRLLKGAQLMCAENLPAHTACYLRRLAEIAAKHAEMFETMTTLKMDRDLELSGVIEPAPAPTNLTVFAPGRRGAVETVITDGEAS